jgi:muramoyltetrapeptide carboxypeptidase
MSRWPQALASGARVALVAPAGPLRGETDLARAIENARSFGWEVEVGAHALERRGYFAGCDADRLGDLNAAIANPRVDGIWCLRGGYGAMRLLDGVDFETLARRELPLIGYSDVTALHLGIAARTDLISVHGPTARARLTEISREAMRRVVVDRVDSCGVAPDARVLREGYAVGRLAGGNLALLAALAGTPYAPRFDGAIVVLEDVNEAVYRVDRMLQQLRLAGIFRGAQALIFGECTNCPEESDDGARRLDDVLSEMADALALPCLAGVPVGHIDDQWTLPLGAVAELDAGERRLTVVSRPAA